MILVVENEGVGFFDMEFVVFECLGGEIRYNVGMVELFINGEKVMGVVLDNGEIILV